MARQGGGRTVGGSARQKLLLLGEDQRSGDAGKEKSTFFPSGKEKPSSAEQPGQCRLSCVRSFVENSRTNELFGPGEEGCSGNSALALPGSLSGCLRSGLCCDGNWVSADCSETMNQLQPIFNNEKLKHNQQYIHSATALSDYMQQLVPAASFWTHILYLAF